MYFMLGAVSIVISLEESGPLGLFLLSTFFKKFYLIATKQQKDY